MIDHQIAENVEAIIRQTAEDIVCPHFRNLGEGSINTKTSPGDVVTIADIQSEEFLTKNLANVMDGSVVLGEETYYKHPETQACLHNDKPVWIIDPIDGTANYAQGSPIFGLIVSLVRNCETIAGWMFDPLGDRMFSCQRGEGVQRNGVTLTLPKTAPRAHADLTGCLGRRSTEPFLGTFKNLIRSGCSAHDYMSICEGEMDFRYFKSLNPWDHAAGVLMVTEMGGSARLMDGGQNYAPVFHATNTMLVTQKSDEWDDIHRTLSN